MIIVFSDLDGTILDSENYSPAAARPGLLLLREKNIPLIPASSKTFEEMCLVANEIGCDGPLIFENGGGIAYPSVNGYRIEELGMPVDELLEGTGILTFMMNKRIRLVRDMDISEIMHRTGFDSSRAEMVKLRRFSLPFVPEGPSLSADEIARINDHLEKWGFHLTRAERFHYFTSLQADKAEAMTEVVDYYRHEKGIEKIITLAIGDSINDLPMLKLADCAYLVRCKDGSFIDTGCVDITVTDEPGPSGFTEAIRRYFSPEKKTDGCTC